MDIYSFRYYATNIGTKHVNLSKTTKKLLRNQTLFCFNYFDYNRIAIVSLLEQQQNTVNYKQDIRSWQLTGCAEYMYMNHSECTL